MRTARKYKPLPLIFFLRNEIDYELTGSEL